MHVGIFPIYLFGLCHSAKLCIPLFRIPPLAFPLRHWSSSWGYQAIFGSIFPEPRKSVVTCRSFLIAVWFPPRRSIWSAIIKRAPNDLHGLLYGFDHVGNILYRDPNKPVVVIARNPLNTRRKSCFKWLMWRTPTLLFWSSICIYSWV